jgi:hypothetical protein
MPRAAKNISRTIRVQFHARLTVAPYLRRETNAELQATNIYNKPGDDPGAPDAASGTGAG